MSDIINMNIPNKKNIRMNLVNQNGIGMDVNTGGTKDHSKLKNLDYEHSGHTGFQKEIDFNNKIASDLIDDTQSNNKFVSTQEKEYWNDKSDFSGDYNDLTNKPNIPIKLSDLTNDVGFITNTVNNLINYYLKSETYTKDEVNTLIGQISTVSILVVQQLPQTGETNIIYFVPKSVPNPDDIYNEYIYVNNTWELIGNTQIDLSNYYTKTETNTLLSGKQNEITSSNKLNSDLITDTNQINKFVTENEKTTWNSAVQPSQLATVATTGEYSDLLNIPSYLRIRTDLGATTNLNTLAQGIWGIKNIAHTDFPLSGAMFGVLIQYSGDYKPQMFIAGGAGECHMYYRRWLTGSSSWTPWEKDGAIYEFNNDYNLINENGNVKAFTDTGDIIDDRYITERTVSLSNPKVFITEQETLILYNGTNKILISSNGIDFTEITLDYNISNMIYNTNNKKIIALGNNNYILESEDEGYTWTAYEVANKTIDIIIKYASLISIVGFNKNLREVYTGMINPYTNVQRITTTITPEFASAINDTQIIWADSNGNCKYLAGARESNFASIPNYGTINFIKNVEGKTFVGLKNSNKLIYLNGTTVTSQWAYYELPDTCTVNDIIYNSYDETYYILTNINNYYKTKDFNTFISVNTNELRMTNGVRAKNGLICGTNTTSVVTASARIKIENFLQNVKRGLDKSKWVGRSLELDEDGKVNVYALSSSPINTIGGLTIKSDSIDYNLLESNLRHKLLINIADFPVNTGDLTPTDEFMDSFIWDNPEGWDGSSTWYRRVRWNDDGTWHDPFSYVEEYTVQKYEIGCIYLGQDEYGTEMIKYEKIGVFAPIN